MSLTYVVKISKAGFSVHDDINKQNFIFRSDLVSMAQKSVIHPSMTTVSISYTDSRYAQNSTVGSTVGAVNGIIPHNFGYIPKLLAFATGSDSNYHQVPGGLTTIATSDKGDELFEVFELEIDETYIYLYIEAFTYTLIPQVSTTTAAKLFTYTYDIVLFMERIGLGLIIKTQTKVMQAKGSIT